MSGSSVRYSGCEVSVLCPWVGPVCLTGGLDREWTVGGRQGAGGPVRWRAVSPFLHVGVPLPSALQGGVPAGVAGDRPPESQGVGAHYVAPPTRPSFPGLPPRTRLDLREGPSDLDQRSFTTSTTGPPGQGERVSAGQGVGVGLWTLVFRRR